MDYISTLSEEEKSKIIERAEQLQIKPEFIFELGLPISIIDYLSDEDLLKQVTIVKGHDISEIKDEKVVVLPKEEIIKEEIIEDSTMVEEEPEEIEDVKVEPIEEEIVETKQTKHTKTKKTKTKETHTKHEVESDDDYISNMNIIKVSSITARENFNNKKDDPFSATYEVTLPQSGYNAKVRGLKVSEIDKLKNSIERSPESRRDTLSKIVYSCIVDTGMRNFSYEEFVNYTAILDFNILLFGIMNQTYGELRDYTFICPNCGSEFNRKVPTMELVSVEQNSKAAELTSKIANTTDPESEFKNSVLRKYNKKFRIPDTDFVINFKFMNLRQDQKVVSNLANLTEEDKSTRLFFLTMITNTLYVPQYDQSGTLIGHAEVNYPSEIFKYLDTIKSSSYNPLLEKIEKILDDYTIAFKTAECTCPSCGSLIPSSKVEIADYFLLQTYKDE